MRRTIHIKKNDASIQNTFSECVFAAQLRRKLESFFQESEGFF